MWLSKNLISGSDISAASAGAVSSSADRRVSASAAGGRGQYAMVAPPGIIACPKKSEEAVVIQTVSGQMCIGVRTGYHGQEIEPGELIFRSDGGAMIKLANNGKIYLNGKEYVDGHSD